MTLPATPTGGEDVRLVPVECTDEMAVALVHELGRQMSYLGWEPTALWSAMLSAAPSVSAPGREAVARVIALHGLGTDRGQSHREPPNASWTQEEWERRILDCVPTQVEEQCYALADAILALTGTGAGWQPIETAPKDGTPILAWFWSALASSAYGWADTIRWHNGMWWDDRDGPCQPVAWMQRPAPPTTNPRASTPADTGAGQGEGAGS